MLFRSTSPELKELPLDIVAFLPEAPDALDPFSFARTGAPDAAEVAVWDHSMTNPL